MQKYLGPLSEPDVLARTARLGAKKAIPARFYSLFWDVDPGKIDVRKNSRYIIERVLELGGLDAMLWIQRLYPTDLIIDICATSRKISPRSRNFWEIWLGISYAH